MNIFIDDGTNHVLTKRMLPIWQKDGHRITGPQEAHVHLTFVQFLQHTNLPKVIRLDGVYYDIDNPECNGRNQNIDRCVELARGVIYQSQFSQEWCSLRLPHTKGKPSQIIYNGIEPLWCGEHHDSGSFDIIAIASWRRWKRLKEIIQVFKAFSGKHHEARLHIIGQVDVQEMHSNILYHGKLSMEQALPIFRDANASLYLAKRDWCPNALVETLGAGIPVITTDACGGATELALMTKNCVVVEGEKNPDEPLRQYTEEYNKLPPGIEEKLLKALEFIYIDSPRVALPQPLNIQTVARAYMDFMVNVQSEWAYQRTLGEGIG